MANYGKAALRAVELIRLRITTSPEEAWGIATDEIFSKPEARKKPCPRCTFLGLCESGLVAGVPPGNYTKSIKNKAYGLRALDHLRQTPALASDIETLWMRVVSGAKKSRNGQMEVVIALWKSGFLS